MKKLLIILMVVAMASFLFVGCNGPDTYTLTMIVNPTEGGITVPVVGAHPNYTAGSLVSVIAIPATGYEFVKWTGDVVDAPNSASATVTMDSDKTVIANFKEEAVEPEPNQAPVITSTAITSGKVGVAYTYDVDATDPDEDILTYSLTGKPLGMAIVAATGVISWDPTDAGVFGVGVKVSDPDGLFDVQGFSIVVAEADEEEPGPEEPTVAPIITSVPDIVDGYINKANAADGIVVNGTAPTYSEVKVYIDVVFAGTGDTLANGTFSVVVANADLIKSVKTDGAKVLYAKATEIGKLESVPSNEEEFILDTKLPGIKEVKATAFGPSIGGDAEATPASAGTCVNPASLIVNPANIVPGVWTIDVLGWFINNVRITDPDGVPTTYSWIPGGYTFAANAPIPGVSFQLKPWPGSVDISGVTIAFVDNVILADTITDSGDGFVTAGFVAGDFITVADSAANDGTYTIAAVTPGVLTLIPADALNDEVEGASVTITAGGIAVGQQSQIVCTALTPGIPSRATLEFDEDVSGTAVLAGTYTINAAATGVPGFYKESNDTCYWLSPAGVGPIGTNALFIVSDVADLAGNVIAPFSSDDCVVGAASLTVLAP